MEKAIRFFVSFSSRDLKYVREIMAAMKGQGIDFWDYSDIAESIEAGNKIDSRLSREIDACTHMIVVISKNSMNAHIGRFCRFELEYALNSNAKSVPYFIPVIVESHDGKKLKVMIGKTINRLISAASKPHQKLILKPPYDIFEKNFRLELDESPESVVKFTVKICQTIDKVYIPPIEAHANLPFWKLFRKEVEELVHSNNVHVEIMMILGEFNEYYKKAEMQMALKKISFFIDTCDNRVLEYKPFYPLIVKAVCETELKLLDDAMKSYEKAKSINPKNQDVIGGIGTIYFKTREFRKAADCFEQIIKTNTNEDVTNARINLIITRQNMGVQVTAEEERFLFSVNTDLYPDDLKTAILNAQAVQHRIKKDYKALENLCKAIISKNLHDTITIRLLQISYINRGMREAAKQLIFDAMKEADQNKRLDKDVLKTYDE
ncbi:MAG: TIR domain-containing protein [Draconibacterium sp.]|nr:TIR domain-containing protein [Draconibacterium sp.]